MPFTFSHPAIILPLSRISKNRISLTGLISGSLSPDFEYFIQMEMIRTHSHEISAMLWFTLPLSLLMALFYHSVVRDVFISHLPHYFHSKLIIYTNYNWQTWFKKYWYVFFYSAAIGILSHLVWDSFTHNHGLLGKSPRILLKPLLILSEKPFYEFLQTFSSIVGALYILYFISKMPSQKIKKQPLELKFKYWSTVLLTVVVIVSSRGQIELSTLIATVISGSLLGIIISSSLFSPYENIYQTKNE